MTEAAHPPSKRLRVFWALYAFAVLVVGVLCAATVAGVSGDAASSAMTTLGLVFTTFCGLSATYVAGETYRPSGQVVAAHKRSE